jgi:hypothetical protein
LVTDFRERLSVCLPKDNAMLRNRIPVYTISLPEYTVEQEPDYRAVGSKLDRAIQTHFPGKWMAIRGIGLIDHPDKSLEDLVATIVELGTDQYDPQREGVHAEMYKELPFICTQPRAWSRSKGCVARTMTAEPGAV